MTFWPLGSENKAQKKSQCSRCFNKFESNCVFSSENLEECVSKSSVSRHLRQPCVAVTLTWQAPCCFNSRLFCGFLNFIYFSAIVV